MEGLAGELGEDEDLPEARVDAVADRDVDEAEPAGDGHGGLAPDPGQGIEAAPLAAGHDDGHDLGHGRRPFGGIGPSIRQKRAARLPSGPSGES